MCATTFVATARFGCFYLLTPQNLHHLGEASPGSANRNRTLSSKALLQIPVAVPSFERQLCLTGFTKKMDAVRKLQIESSAELDALLPSILDKAFKGEL